jgi:hypothetical protein
LRIVPIDELGDRRERHADRYLKSPEEMHRLFVRYPEALARTVEIVDRCSFSLDELAYQYPEERADPSHSPRARGERRGPHFWFHRDGRRSPKFARPASMPCESASDLREHKKRAARRPETPRLRRNMIGTG